MGGCHLLKQVLELNTDICFAAAVLLLVCSF